MERINSGHCKDLCAHLLCIYAISKDLSVPELKRYIELPNVCCLCCLVALRLRGCFDCSDSAVMPLCHCASVPCPTGNRDCKVGPGSLWEARRVPFEHPRGARWVSTNLRMTLWLQTARRNMTQHNMAQHCTSQHITSHLGTFWTNVCKDRELQISTPPTTAPHS